MALILRIAQSQQGKITGLPDSVVRDVQAAQTARTTIQAGHNPVPKPPMTPPPRPAIVPPPKPQPVITPPPPPSPPQSPGPGR